MEVDGSCNPPNSRRTLCRWFKWWIKSKIWGPSIGLAETIFCLKLSQIESKLLRNSRHSKRKWFTFSTFSLQIKQSAPSVFKSQGTPPLRPKFPASLIWTCRHFTRSGKLSAIDQNCSGETLARHSWATCMPGWSVQNWCHSRDSLSRILVLTIDFQWEYEGNDEPKNHDWK